MRIQSNHSFCVEWAASQGRGLRVLDYGCGAGEIVSALLERNIDAFGCDVFYEGGDTSSEVARELFARGVVRRMDPQSIPFDDASFDVVISNTVFEHVKSLEATLAEVARVLKPGGKLLSLFPHREVWLEWHVGLPFVHRLPARSWRLWYAVLLRSLGLGFFKAGKPVVAWSRDALDWVDSWTHYRPRAEIERTFRDRFVNVVRLEVEWLEHKLDRAPLLARLPAWSKQSAVTTLAGLVFECQKPLETLPATRKLEP